MSNILKIIKSRRNIKYFKPNPISNKVLTEILEAARWAPSAHNFQPWRFVIVKNKKIKEQVVEIINKTAKKLYAGFNIVLKDSIVSINNAPILLLIYSKGTLVKKFSKYGRVYRIHMNSYEDQSIAAAIQNIILTAQDKGIGSRWLGILSFCEKEINKIIGTQNRLVAVLTLGRPSDIPNPPKRKELKEIVDIIN